MLNNKNNIVNERSCFGPVPLSKQMASLTKKLVGTRGFSNADLLLHWSDIVGEEMAKGVKPDKMTYPKGDREQAVLHVRVSAGSFAVVVEHQKNIILEKINTFLGYNAVSDIKIKQEALEMKTDETKQEEINLSKEQSIELSKKLENIKDEQLREKLFNIGKRIFFK